MATPFLTPPVRRVPLANFGWPLNEQIQDSPHSDISNDMNQMLLSMSTTFYPQDDAPTNLVIVTSDNVLFAVVSIHAYFCGFFIDPVLAQERSAL